jgi:hypothetical protein
VRTKSSAIGRIQYSLSLVNPSTGAAQADAYGGTLGFYGGAIHSSTWGDFAPFEISALFALAAGVSYKCLVKCDFESPGTGPWSNYFLAGIHGLDNFGARPRY